MGSYLRLELTRGFRNPMGLIMTTVFPPGSTWCSRGC